MFADLRYFWVTQRATAFMFAVSLVALAASAIGVVWQFVRGNLVVGSALAVATLVCAGFAWVIGSAILAVARQSRSNGAQ